MPTKVLRCINSWKKFLPDYQFILWNEKIFSIENSCRFVREAYNMGHYAFVADYVRFYALYNYGGIYLDTDVEFLKPISYDILDNELVLALDDGGYITGSTLLSVKNGKFLKDNMDYYENMNFVNTDGTLNNEVINTHMQEVLKHYGYVIENKFQTINYNGENCIIFPNEYFHVRSLVTGKLELTQNSIAIHWHTILWASYKTKIINFLRIKFLVKVLGVDLYSKMTNRIKNGKTTF